MVVSPCYVLPFTGGADKGAGQLPISGFPRPAVRGCKCAPFLFPSGAHSHNLNPGIMSRQIYYEANSLCCVGPWSAGIAVPFAGVVPIRTALAPESGRNRFNYAFEICNPGRPFFHRRVRATEMNSSICKVASLDCFGPASAF